MSRAILAIDPGIQTGWALGHRDLSMETGTEYWPLLKDEPPGARWSRFRPWLINKLHVMVSITKAYALVDLLVLEAPIGMAQRGVHANRAAMAWGTIAEEVAFTYGVNYLEVHPSTLKAFATGSGRSDKATMIKGALERWPKHFPRGTNKLADPGQVKGITDLADAMWLLEFARGVKFEEVAHG